MSTSSYILSPPATPQSHMLAYEASIATGDGYGSGGTPDNPFFYSAQSSMTHLPATAQSPIKSSVKYEGNLLPPIGLASEPYAVPKKIDMGFPGKGTEAAKAGIQTPLAQYTSQMVSWLWFGRYTPARYYPDGTPMVSDPFEYPLHNPLHPCQVAPTIEFERFVDRLLHITQVSHSVVLVSLLYIYRLKNRYHIEAGAGTEMRAFVAGLILANKYLDDNTYTTKTWAELTGLPLREVCRMEVEFLRGLQYRLCVSKTDYTTWRHLLDGFIFSRSTGGIYRSRFNPSFHHSASPTNPLITPATSYIPSHPYTAYTDVRARSVSPQTAATYSPSSRYYTPKHDYSYRNSASTSTGSTYGYGRKRSAVDAFAGEYTSQVAGYGRPQRKAHARAHAEPALSSGTSSIGLVRSSSCNRQIARLPGSAAGGVGRRGSAGNMRAGLYGQESDLRHTAANHAAYLTYEQSKGKETVPDAGEGWWTTLVAPCDQYPEAHAIPPEQMTFYTVAATPHMGQDGAPRKAILRHQDPHPYSYPPQYQPYVDPKPAVRGWANIDDYTDDTVSPTAAYNPEIPASTSYLTPSYEGYYPSDQVYPAGQTTVESEPAQFANAGPPGYAYDPTAIYSAGLGYDGTAFSGMTRWSTNSEEMALAHAHAYGHTGSASELWRTRSEWSSPMPGHDGWMRA